MESYLFQRHLQRKIFNSILILPVKLLFFGGNKQEIEVELFFARKGTIYTKKSALISLINTLITHSVCVDATV